MVWMSLAVELRRGVDQGVVEVLTKRAVAEDAVRPHIVDVVADHITADLGHRSASAGTVGGHVIGEVEAANLLHHLGRVNPSDSQHHTTVGDVDGAGVAGQVEPVHYRARLGGVGPEDEPLVGPDPGDEGIAAVFC